MEQPPTSGFTSLERPNKGISNNTLMRDLEFSNSLPGFTFIESMVVIAVISIIAGISLVGFENLGKSAALKAVREEVYQTLIDARNQTLASKDATVYGVLVGTSSIIRFTGPTYTPGASGNMVYQFEGGVTATGTPVTMATPFIFERLSGALSATGTIFLGNSDGTATRTITVHASGLVQ
jgi:prepilin-type N-terminal cleavage/methylation domain-containing protein